ncbi:MAG: ABC transporter ATP-binding protein, partial [Proteobacteria bacterium]|nr:ABC transporter ATP-binding protein [Pseudomonadota bacterium]
MKKVLEVENLTKRFGKFAAVDSVSFEMYKGEILGLMGPNGAGKTTTLHMLLDLTTPTSGTIKLFGLGYCEAREEILSRVNFSSSYISLPSTLTVIENLNVMARVYGIKGKRKRAELIESLMKKFEIEGYAKASTRRLSSGQLTRVCLVKALLNSPDILFLDEPTASLDPDIADKTRTLLRSIRDERNTSILYSSHNMAEMEELCDRIIIMNKGCIVAVGTATELLEKYQEESLEEVFLKITRASDDER